ncbi:hypothetical protein CC86DRAFT_368125 [Ophiobolus disseminans]|uniref:F-box domain-containing protein n=1 Tax=Ophiobolus disseminans TaxID=1469910 RepID=A0A6A7A8E7_9PLEO|nr:hypothetical protein CC86DRAFT_368125 [Ophiobolus disseminans]
MASLNLLPTELTDLIIQDLSRQDIRSLVKACKSLHAAALPALYGELNVHCSRFKSKDKNAISPDNVKQLCRTLILRPDFARHIRTFEMRHGDLTCHELRISRTERKLFKKAIDSQWWYVIGPREWKEDLDRENHFAAVLPLVISQCERLRKLSISNNYANPGSWLWSIIKSSTEPKALRELSSVRVVCDVPQRRFEQNAMELFLSSPEIEVLVLSSSRPGASVRHDLDLQRMAAAVAETRIAGTFTALSILRSSLSTSGLRAMLKQTPQLRVLECTFLYAASEGFLDLNILRAGLDIVRTTLVHLVLRFDIYDSQGTSARELSRILTGDLGFLREFTSLTTLETSLALLFGQNGLVYRPEPLKLPCSLADTLPPRLHKLRIADDLWTFKPFAWSEIAMTMDVFKLFFVGDYMLGDRFLGIELENQVWKNIGYEPWKTSTPELREFVFDIRMRGRDSPNVWVKQDVRDELQRVCESQGIKCSILHGNLG